MVELTFVVQFLGTIGLIRGIGRGEGNGRSFGSVAGFHPAEFGRGGTYPLPNVWLCHQ